MCYTVCVILIRLGKKHSFSAGLLIGGMNLKNEKERISKMNILVATPGRLLQHMDQTPDFNYLNLQILVLDEADRILDSGKLILSFVIQTLLDTVICNPNSTYYCHSKSNSTYYCHSKSNSTYYCHSKSKSTNSSGFEKTLNSILENLPPRQTLLFSATQTKAVKDLARLSVKVRKT